MLTSVDVRSIVGASPHLHLIWSSPLRILLSTVMVHRWLGLFWTSLILAAIVSSVLAQIAVSRKLQSLSKQGRSTADARVRGQNEVLDHMQYIRGCHGMWEQGLMRRLLTSLPNERSVMRMYHMFSGLAAIIPPKSSLSSRLF